MSYFNRLILSGFTLNGLAALQISDNQELYFSFISRTLSQIMRRVHVLPKNGVTLMLHLFAGLDLSTGLLLVLALLYQYVDGAGFFTSHGQPSKQVRLVRYIWDKRYRDHHDDEFIRRCERVRGQFVLTSGLCFLVVVSLIAMAIWQ